MKNEIKVALTIFAALLIGFLGYRYMTGAAMFGTSYQVYSLYDRVDGIETGAPVVIQGIKVGEVSSLSFGRNDSIRVVYSLSLPDYLPEGSVAYIRSLNLFEKGIVIERGSSSEKVRSGGFVRGVYDEGALGRAEKLLEDAGPNLSGSTMHLKSLLGQFDSLMTDGGKQDLQETISGLNRTIGSIEGLLDSKKDEIGETISSLRRTIENIEGITDGQDARIDSLLANLESTSQKLDRLTGEMTDASTELNGILRKINEGEGSLGLLINDPSLYNNLDSLSYNLARLVKELNDNPRHFLKHVKLIDLF